MWDLSSLTAAWTHVPCIGSLELTHWTTGEVPSSIYSELVVTGLSLSSRSDFVPGEHRKFIHLKSSLLVRQTTNEDPSEHTAGEKILMQIGGVIKDMWLYYKQFWPDWLTQGMASRTWDVRILFWAASDLPLSVDMG